jgi:hypothetical protein
MVKFTEPSWSARNVNRFGYVHRAALSLSFDEAADCTYEESGA